MLGFLKDKLGDIWLKITIKIIKRKVEKMEWLKGKKTYAISIIGGIMAGGNIVLKLLNNQPVGMDDIVALLGAFGLGTLRAGIKNG